MSRRFQFTLRDMLVLAFALSLMLGIAATLRHRYEIESQRIDVEQKAAAEAFVEQIKKIGSQNQ